MSQNSREPVTEPDEMVPLWKILHLAEHCGGNYHVAHFWTIIALSLGVLAENEREYLGEDLKEVWLPGAPATPDPFADR